MPWYIYAHGPLKTGADKYYECCRRTDDRVWDKSIGLHVNGKWCQYFGRECVPCTRKQKRNELLLDGSKRDGFIDELDSTRV
jgi:hypothetical protein